MEKIIIPRSDVASYGFKLKKDKNVNLEVDVEKTENVSDGYHTFGELYEHRIEIWIISCLFAKRLFVMGAGKTFPWRSKKHSDGSVWDRWFILGIGMEKGEQITYHLPIERWDDCEFAETLEKAPEWDGHTSNDVLERLKNWRN